MANSNVYSNKNNKGKFSIVNQRGGRLLESVCLIEEVRHIKLEIENRG